MPQRTAYAAEGATAAPRPGQQRRRQAMEEKLLVAGLAELGDSPRSELTIRGVAMRAGVSPANAYKYFSSKNALVAAIYLDLLEKTPLRAESSLSVKQRVITTMKDMAIVVADKPELAVACAAALVVNEPAVGPFRARIATEVRRRIRAALGPGWVESVGETLQLTLFGALIAARFEDFDLIVVRLENAVHLVLGAGLQ